MTVKFLAEHNLEFLSLKGGCRGSSESTHVKMPHCCKSRVTTQFKFLFAKRERTLRTAKQNKNQAQKPNIHWE